MQDVVMPPITILSALDAVDDIIVPPIGGVSACEAVDDVIVPPIGGVSACEAVVDVIVPPIGGLSACEAVVDVIVPPTAASGAVKNVTVPPTVMAVVSGTARPVAVKIRMRKVPASVLKTISGFENLLDSSLEGKEVRQVEPGQVDEKGEAIGGKWVISDGVSACTGDSANNSNQWVRNKKNVDKEKAKSFSRRNKLLPGARWQKTSTKKTERIFSGGRRVFKGYTIKEDEWQQRFQTFFVHQ
jgi:hypothetical protein